jgi:hypothetical protein
MPSEKNDFLRTRGGGIVDKTDLVKIASRSVAISTSNFKVGRSIVYE